MYKAEGTSNCMNNFLFVENNADSYRKEPCDGANI